MLKQTDALWRAAVYVSVVLLHLQDDVLLRDPLRPEHIKDSVSGHWGTVPGTAWALTHTAVARGGAAPGHEVVPVIGAGHAGVVQLAFAWLTGELACHRPQYTRDAEGLARLAREFPGVSGLGSEVHPLLAGGAAPGGCLGGTLAFSHGLALDAPGRVVVPIIGDGECETPTAAGSWLAARALSSCTVVPIVHVNGFRMGAASLLGAMEDTQLGAYLAGMGWDSRVVTVRVGLPGEHRAFQEALQDAIEKSTGGTRTAVVLRCVKGWGGPASVAGRPVLGTADAHKTPMLGARRDATERRQLEEWLASYRPAELFDHRGHPTGELAEALRLVARPTAAPGRPAPRPGTTPVAVEPGSRFGPAVTATLRAHAAAGDLRVFSPDELSSNRLGTLAGEPWVAEVLAEEVLLAWLAGWTASGRRGVLISYEAFSPLLTAGIIAHLKHRRLAGPAPSLNLLLTSYGWHNVYSHADPSLATALLAAGDPAVRVLTPADPQRTAVALDEALGSTGRFNVIIAGKHVDVHHPQRTIAEEQNEGMAVWQHLSDATDAPDLTLVVAGDLPAQAAEGALPAIRRRLGCRVRVVCVLDLTVLGDPALWPRGLSDAALDSALGGNAAVLVVTLGHPAAIWGLLAGRLRRRHVDVIGWREPAHPMLQNELVQFAGLDPAGLCAAAERVVAAARGSAG